MTVLDVYVNNRKVCRAGVGKDGVLDAIVSWVKLTGAAADAARRLKRPIEESRLHVGGLRDDTHRWWAARRLRTGDRVTIVMNRATRFDRPARETRRTRADVERQKRSYYRRLKEQFDKSGADSTESTETADQLTRFLNVDLDIWSSSPLESLVRAFGKHVIVLYVGKEGRKYGAHLELSVQSDSAERIIRRFVTLIERLPRSARRTWNGARVREFNVGIQAASRPYSFDLRLAPETLRAAARVNARIGVSVYGAR